MQHTAELETSIMVSFAQILEGDASCRVCERPANVTLHAGAVYLDTPMCWKHARPFIDLARDMGERFWG